MRWLCCFLLLVLISVSVRGITPMECDTTFVGGDVYTDENTPVAGANVTVECAGYMEKVQTSGNESVEGRYIVSFEDCTCPPGSEITVEAAYGSMSGNADGFMDETMVTELDILMSDILIPEYNTFTSILALVFAFLIRRRIS